jgi:hypothetical protein
MVAEHQLRARKISLLALAVYELRVGIDFNRTLGSDGI